MASDFYGVYLLYCLNKRFRDRIYIGFTVNPTRRLSQHNKGKDFGGAKRTNNKGPWDMALIVSGFPTETSALRFEWAWQNPQMSRRLKFIVGRKTQETSLSYHLRILNEMICCAPWSRLPLTINWLNRQIITDLMRFIPDKPSHMDVHQRPPVQPLEHPQVSESSECAICRSSSLQIDFIRCYHPDCTLSTHTTCLAARFLKGSDQILPVSGACPRCCRTLVWGQLVRPLMKDLS